MPSGRPCAAEAPQDPDWQTSLLAPGHAYTQLRRGRSNPAPCSESALCWAQPGRAPPHPRPWGNLGIHPLPGAPGTGGQNWILKMRHTEFCRKGQQEDAHHRTHPGHWAGWGLPSGGSPRLPLHPLGCRLVTHPHPGGSSCGPGAVLPPAARSQPRPEGPVWAVLPLLPGASPGLKDQCGHHTGSRPARHLGDHPKTALRPCVFPLLYLKPKNSSK